ncbi:MAG TPA: alpha helical protein [Chloroflexota bacterium]|nr:alpha helical protein [Chloroflexota bacterium]
MPAHAGEKAWETGTFKCQSCNAEVRVQKGHKIPECPNGHKTFDERIEEPARSRSKSRSH